MKINQENFDETALKVSEMEPYVTLHLIRAILKRLTEAQRPRAEGEEPAIESVEAVTEQLVSQLKKLVESPSIDLNPVPLQQIKDIFNGIVALLEDWRNILQADKVRRFAHPGQEFGTEYLVYILQAAAMLSWQTNSNEFADNTNILNEIIKETDDVRVLISAFRLKCNVGGNSQRVPDIFQKVAYCANAQNLLRSQGDHFTLQEISLGKNKAGEDIIAGDFIFEIERSIQGFSERTQKETITVPRERILTPEKTSSQVAEELVAEFCKGVSDTKLQAKLDAKIIWFRSLTIPEIAKRPLRYYIKLIQAAYLQRQNMTQDYNPIQDSFYIQARDYITENSDKDTVITLCHALCVLYKGRGETTGYDPFIDVPRAPSDSNEESQSWMLKALQDLSSAKLDPQTGGKVFKLTVLNESFVKSSDFQWVFLRFFRNLLYYVQSKQLVLNMETTSMISALFKLLRIEVPTPPSLEGDEIRMQELPVLTYHTRVAIECVALLKILARPRHEEQVDIIANYENRLEFEINNIQAKLVTASDGEDFYQEQTLQDRLDLCVGIIAHLHDLSARDQTGTMTRKIQESKILGLFLKLKGLDNFQILDGLVPQFFLLIGQICNNSPGVTPQLIRAGLIPLIFEIANERLPETEKGFQSFVFCMSQVIIHDEGKQIALNSSALQSVLRQVTEKLKFYDLNATSNNLFHTKQYIKSIVERDALYKDILKAILEEQVQKGIEIAKDLKVKYFKIASQSARSIKERNDEIVSNIKKSDEFKILTLIQRLLLNFIGQPDTDYEGRHVDVRWTLGIITPDFFIKILEIIDIIGQNPCLSEMSIKYAKCLKPFLEVNNYPGNVDKFIDQWHQKLKNLEAALGGKPFSQMETLPLDLKEEDEKMDGSESFSAHIVSNFHSFLVHSLAFQSMHSASIILIGTRDKVKELIEGTLNLFNLICKTNCAEKVQEVQLFLSSPKEDEKEEKERRELLMTRQEYLDILSAEEAKNDSSRNLSRKFERGTNTFLSQKIPSLADNLLCLREALTKFSMVQFQNQRPGRDNNQNREAQEKNFKFIGQLSLKFVKSLMRYSLKIGNLDNSPQTCYNLMMIINIIDNMISLAGRGWFSSIALFEFFVSGGLKCLTDAFNLISDIVQKMKPETVLGSQWSIFEVIAQRLSNFLLKYIIEDDKSVRDQRMSEVYMVNLFQYKMDPHFDNTKQFIQNVCFTLCSELLSARDKNPLLVSPDKAAFSCLNEVPMTLLSSASKQFQNCATLKVGFGNAHRNFEMRGDDRGARGFGGPRAPMPPNPMHVQQILDLGFGYYHRDQIIQALQQNRDDVNRAIDWLLTQQPRQPDDPFAQILNAIDNPSAQIQAQVQDEEDEDVDIILNQIAAAEESALLEEQQQSIPQPKPKDVVLQKPKKVTEAEVQDLIKKILHSGFDWLTEAFDTLPDFSRSQNVLLEIMKNWKTEVSGIDQDKEMKKMFGKIDEILKVRLLQKVSKELDSLFKNSQQDVQMIEESKDKHSEACQAIHKAGQFLRLVQRLISSQKAYLKEAIVSDIPMLCHKQINYLMDLIKNNDILKDQTSSISICVQFLIHSFLYTLFTIVHIQQLSITVNLAEKQRRNQATQDIIAKIKTKYTHKLPPQMLMILCTQLIDSCKAGHLKHQILLTSFSLGFRLIQDKNAVTLDYRGHFIQNLFSKLTEVLETLPFDKLKGMDNNLINSIAILFFETDAIIQGQLEKFIQRVLFTKYEYQIENAKKEKEATISHQLSKVNMNNFVSFFKQLSAKSPESFKKILNDCCEVKIVKVNGKTSQDRAEIMLKETVLTELKKNIAKERGVFKQTQKVIDLKSDKQVKTHIQVAKKALLSQIPEEVKDQFQNFMLTISATSSKEIADLDSFIAAQAAGTPFMQNLKDESQGLQGMYHPSTLEMLAKLCQAYPAYTTIMMPQKQSQQLQLAKKTNFIQWYIKEFLVTQSVLKLNVNPRVPGEQHSEIEETTYKMKSVETLKLLGDHVSRFLNRLTSFNHLMTLNEQLVKHSLRSKFLFEALSLLQRKIKEKSPVKSNIKQKATILACLNVIESLINPSALQVKSLNISQDNFLNSIRLCVVRDSQQSGSDQPQSLIKILDDLLSDYVDVSVDTGVNSDLVTKSVTLLKILSEFITQEKKKEELAAAQDEEEAKQIEIVGDQIMRQASADEGDVAQQEEESEGSLMESENQEEPVHAHQHQQIEAEMLDEEEADEDDENEEDDDENEDDAEEDEPALPGGQDHLIIEDDYDEEAPDDDDDDDLDAGAGAFLIRENRRGPGGPANDIININANQQDRFDHRPMMFGRPPRGERIGLGGQVDWSQEEQEVQRILGNFRSNMPENVPEPVPANRWDHGFDHHRHIFGGDRHRQNQAEPPRKGLIDSTYEDLRIISDQDIFNQVMNAQNSFDREINALQNLIGAQNAIGLAPRVQVGLGGLERQPGIPHLFGRHPIVDELDDEDFGRPMWMPPPFGEGLINDQDNRILDILQNEHDILHRLLRNEGLIPPQRIAGGGGWGGLGDRPPGQRRPGAPGGGENDAVLENGQFMQQMRSSMNQIYNQGSSGIDQMAQQILQTVQVQIEEEQKVDPVPPQIPPIGPGIGGSQIDNMFRQVFGQSMNDPLDMPPLQQNDQQLLQDFLNPLGMIPPSQALIRPGSPSLVQQQRRASIQMIPEQIEQPILEPSLIIPQENIILESSNINQLEPQPAADLPVEPQPVDVQPEPQPGENIAAVITELLQQVQIPASSDEAVPQHQQLSQEEEKKEEEVKQEASEHKPAQSDAAPNTTFGYDNDLLMTYGIDPAILLELPEELRIELLSTIDLPAINQQVEQQRSASSQENQQPPAQEQPSANNANEEQKQEVQPGVQQQPGAQPAEAQQPEYYAIARELGLDPEFLANLPEDMRMELIQQAQLERAPPVRQPEQMDLATLLATVTDIHLRREMFMNMDQATLNSLPPALMAEGRAVQDYQRNDRQRIRNQMAERFGARNMMHPGGEEADILGGGMFGRRRREEAERLGRQQQPRAPQEKNIEEVVEIRMRQIASEAPKDDIISSINTQLIQDEKIIEALITILMTNEKIQCDLIPCLQYLTKIQNSNGIPVIRNKVVNVMTFIMKNLAVNNDQALTDLGFKAAELKKKNCILILIGTLRLLLKSNKSLMKYILKGLIQREDTQSKGPGTQMLRKQLKAIGYKQPVPEEFNATQSNQDSIDTSSKKVSKERPFVTPSPLAEIFSLIKVDLFKQEKTLMRNLTLLIHQILKNFDIARQELEASQHQISQETISTIAEVLSLENIDAQMMEDLGDFLFKISKQKKTNFALISDYCLKKSSALLDKLSSKLNEFTITFDDIKGKISPSKHLGLNSREMSQLSGHEEEKGDGMINTSSFALSSALGQAYSSALAPTQSKVQQIKLEDEDEKRLRQLLKVYDDSEVLYRIFKLFNLFYDKFSSEKLKAAGAEDQQMEISQNSQSIPSEVITFVRQTYENDDLKIFVSTVSDVLRIVLKTGIEPNEGVSNLIFCVLSSFYPELFESIEVEKQEKAKEKKEAEEKKGDKAKFQVKMLPLLETGPGHISKEKFTLFRNSYYFTNRIQELSNFCMVNKRIINKMIKQKPNLFVNELEGLIRHMPNLLDFDNKRTYFKKELSKLKRGHLFGDQIQLYIRRDDIFQDSFSQIRDKTANEMKGRLHISFTGERGQDAGGLTRDFFIELSREMFNPNYSLFILSSSGSTYYPNPKSHVEVQHLSYFKFIGRMVGKAIFDECLLECYFVKSLYKIMTGEPLCFSDLEDFDNEFYNNMKWCLENDVDCLMTTFVAETDYFGKPLEVELIEGGKTIPVTNQNKREYVEKLCYFKLYSEIQKQVDNFLEGFYELIPKELVSVFNYKELELLISGLPNFDLNDLKANTEFSGYTATSQQVLWLWEVLESFDSSERAEFLQFVTGSSKVPLDGFKGLIGMRGPQKFTIAKIKTDDFMRLPSGHTCFNQIDLPEYPSKEILHERLLLAIKETKGFGFA